MLLWPRRIPSTCCLILTMAYARYALDGFEADAVDFLHNPYFYDRFTRAIQKAIQWMRMRDLLYTSESAAHQLTLKSDYKNVAVPISSILYVEAVDNYVKVYVADGSAILSKIPLNQVERQQLSEGFLRVHRSFLVARCRISRFTRTEVIFSRSGKRIPIGRKYARQVTDALC
ncbi:MAG: LytR/AlgR family response regulator transcription factor [Bacteroidaceae bacterium]